MRDPNLVRKEMLEIAEVLPFVATSSDAEALYTIKGDIINMAAPKLQNFALNGVKCHRCKLEGEYFAKEKYPTIPFYHLNLYGMRNGRETQMLRDFIVAIEKGGTDSLENQQTICFNCHKKQVNPPADLEAQRRKRAKKRSENKAKKAAGEVKVKVGEKKPRRI
ncbi:MAG: HNH endonuclease [Chitinophagaceae bacterium]|nr:HNH endonuclease [Oligoflexus sp.]